MVCNPDSKPPTWSYAYASIDTQTQKDSNSLEWYESEGLGCSGTQG